MLTTRSKLFRLPAIGAAAVVTTLMAALFLAVAPASATASAVSIGAVNFATLPDAIAAAAPHDVIDVNENLITTAQVTIDKPVTIDGHSHLLIVNFIKSSNSNNAAIGIQADDVTVSNLNLFGLLGPVTSQLHGYNVFDAANVTLNNTGISGFRSGVTINSSDVTVNGITTGSNIWHALNIDQRTSSPAKLTVSGANNHDENSPNPVTSTVGGPFVPHIFVDDITRDVTVVDTDGQYQLNEVPFNGKVALIGTKAAQLPPPTSSTQIVSADTAAAENTPGWMFNRDEDTSTPYGFLDGNASTGSGSLYVEPISDSFASNKFIAEYFANEPLGTLRNFSIDYKLASNTPVEKTEQVYLNLYTVFGESSPTKFYDCRYSVAASNGSSSSFKTLTFEPTVAAAVTTSGTSPHPCPAQPLGMGGDARLRAASVNFGDTSINDVGLDVFFDNAVLSTDTETTRFDFELNDYSANEAFVLTAFEDFLSREPTTLEFDSATAALDGGQPRSALLRTLSRSPEWVGLLIDDLYLTTLGRPSDPSGKAYWVNRIQRGDNPATIAAHFFASGEYFLNSGGTNSTWVAALYSDVLGRIPDTAGLNFWISTAARYGRPSVARSIYQSEESRSSRVTELYADLLERAPDAAGREFWIRVLANGQDLDLDLAVSLANSAEYYAKASARYP